MVYEMNKNEKEIKSLLNNLSNEDLDNLISIRYHHFIDNFFERIAALNKVKIQRIEYVKEDELRNWFETMSFSGDKTEMYNKMLKQELMNFYFCLELVVKDLEIKSLKYDYFSKSQKESDILRSTITRFFRDVMFTVIKYGHRDLNSFAGVNNYRDLANHFSSNRKTKEHNLVGLKVMKTEFKEHIYQSHLSLGFNFSNLEENHRLKQSNVFFHEILNYDYNEFDEMYNRILKEAEHYRNHVSSDFYRIYNNAY